MALGDLVIVVLPLGQLVYRTRQTTLQPFGDRGRVHRDWSLDHPAQKVVRTAVHVRWGRNRLEHGRKWLFDREIIEDVAEFLDDVPGEGMIDVDSELDPPTPFKLSASEDVSGADGRNAPEIVGKRQELRRVFHDQSRVTTSLPTTRRSAIARIASPARSSG